MTSDGRVGLRAIPSQNIQDSTNALSVGGALYQKKNLKSTSRIFTVSMIKQQQNLLTPNLNLKKPRITLKIQHLKMKKLIVMLKLLNLRQTKMYQRVTLKVSCCWKTCNKNCAQNSNLTSHIENMHSNNCRKRKLQNSNNTQQKKALKIEHKCEPCQKVFSSHSNLKRHTTKTHG